MSMYLPLPMSFTLLYIIVLLFGIPSLQLKELPLEFLSRQVQLLFGKVFNLSFIFWKTGLPEIAFLFGRLFLAALEYIISTPFWPARFLLKSLLMVLWGFFCMWQITFLLLLSKFFVFGFQKCDCNEFCKDSLSSFYLWSFELPRCSVYFLSLIWGIFSLFF